VAQVPQELLLWSIDMQALISPNEKVIDPNTGDVIGERVAEVVAQPFEVAPPLFWTPCANDVQADLWYYDPADQQIKLTPEPAPVADPAQPTTQGAQTL
jgi:hypothetical protein